MFCPKCSNAIHCSDENYGLMWCDNCKSLFSSIDADGKVTHFFSLPENHCEIEPGCKVFYENENGNETFVTSRFSLSGIIMALLAAGWLFITIFSFSINVALACILCVIVYLPGGEQRSHLLSFSSGELALPRSSGLRSPVVGEEENFLYPSRFFWLA